MDIVGAGKSRDNQKQKHKQYPVKKRVDSVIVSKVLSLPSPLTLMQHNILLYNRTSLIQGGFMLFVAPTRTVHPT